MTLGALESDLVQELEEGEEITQGVWWYDEITFYLYVRKWV